MSTEDIDSATKVAFLSRPETYAGRPIAVEAVETHFAWVFLAGRFAYKMKKPLKFPEVDFTTLATRRANCELEVALNRRLAPSVYAGSVPLYAAGGRLSFTGPGVPVEWLVKMHKPPRERSLDRLAAAGQLDDMTLRALVEKLARFYAKAARAQWDGRAYRHALASEVDGAARELAAPALRLDAERIDAIAAELARLLDANARLFHARVADGRVIDAHGDLRPEHIFMLAEPQIIDCLEFSAELRLLDSAAEIAFLALECERLGFPRSASACWNITGCARATNALSTCSISIALYAPSCARSLPHGISKGALQPTWRPPGASARAGISMPRASASTGASRPHALASFGPH